MKSTSTAANKAGNKLGAEGVRPLGDALEVNTTLKTLDLACFQKKSKQEHATPTSMTKAANEIGSQGVRALGNALKNNTTLQSLILEGIQQE